ncbi:MAG: hypothetical protein M3511_07220 [Deinococcota bacterium]|nr:hypothetical protein [Deinococcota bacterium]
MAALPLLRLHPSDHDTLAYSNCGGDLYGQMCDSCGLCQCCDEFAGSDCCYEHPTALERYHAALGGRACDLPSTLWALLGCQ